MEDVKLRDTVAPTIHEFGRHRVRRGDVTDIEGFAKLMRGDKAAMMYSDPPWGEGNIKYWATMNKKMTGNINKPAPLDVFLGAIFNHASRYVTRYMVIEYGVRWRDEIQEMGKAAGFVSHGVVDILYANNLPLDLHLFARPGEVYPDGYAEGVYLTKGYHCVKQAFGPIAKKVLADDPNAIGLDPCCGMGYTAQACIDFGLSFRGNELNVKRLGKTIKRLERSLK